MASSLGDVDGGELMAVEEVRVGAGRQEQSDDLPGVRASGVGDEHERRPAVLLLGVGVGAYQGETLELEATLSRHLATGAPPRPGHRPGEWRTAAGCIPSRCGR